MNHMHTKSWMNDLSRIMGALTLGLALTLSLALAGCGGPQNLEEYINTDEGKQLIEEAKSSADIGDMGTMDIVVEGNNIRYDVTFNMAFDTNPFEQSPFDDDTVSELSESIADMEKETGFEGVTMEYVFKDSEGTLLYQCKIDDQGLVK